HAAEQGAQFLEWVGLELVESWVHRYFRKSDGKLGRLDTGFGQTTDDGFLQACAEFGVGQRLALVVGNEEHVLDALAEGGDLGVLQRQIVFEEDSSDPRQQARTVRSSQFEDGHRTLRVVVNGHLRGEGEVLELARYPALDDGRVVVGILQRFDQSFANLLDARRVV